ncbi:adenylyl-sulfate kinase [Chitinimonas arctica]|uniref:Adenylyl-sulfate kinase n=2 Tax=Chitinimonas arctica TaxID=2594795 RepID=A0A516SMP1_9NEIS|nr:adenylyl-sulfate kinase [Chitinimonas arctica]
MPPRLIIPHPVTITPAMRAARNGHGAAVLLLTGLPAAGKSTAAQALDALLFSQGHHASVLDGDNLRTGLNADLGFSPADRMENLRRAAEAARLLYQAGQIVIVAMIAPLAAHRAQFAERLGQDYLEVWCSAPLASCEARDPKGLYARARAGQLADFTGISAPYEQPLAPALVLDTHTLSPARCAERLRVLLVERGVLPEREVGHAPLPIA